MSRKGTRGSRASDLFLPEGGEQTVLSQAPSQRVTDRDADTLVEHMLCAEEDFLAEFARYNAEALWANGNEAFDAALWFFELSEADAIAPFRKVSEAHCADSARLRRMVFLEFHARQMERLRAHLPRWEQTADWYLGAGQGNFPFPLLERATGMSRTALRKDAINALRRFSPCADTAGDGIAAAA